MKKIIGISDMQISENPEEQLITYSLGSCIGLTLYDRELRIGGLLHSMLPVSRKNKEKAKKKPLMFVDKGIEMMLTELFNKGARRKNLIAKLAGGSKLLDKKDMFKIGRRNYVVARKMLWKNDILIDGEDVGGTVSRTMSLYLVDGRTTVRIKREEKEI
ncbi:MAG: chemotaxis protein CheD [Candidatus Marinimicrobia bacterium]|nr:chemotaxis protein CheD [Candidatus Neomarinimicrobiota bacterium]